MILDKAKNFLKNLRHKPYATKVKILWTITVSVAVILVIIWGYTLRNQISKLDGEKLIDLPDLRNQPQVESKFVKIERVESSAKELKIFFSVKNESNDILNFSRAEEVGLEANNSTLVPLYLLDRQNKPFVQKILSKTENFGILIFPPVQADHAVITFKDLYFEKTPQELLKETIKLNLDELTKDQTLRD